MTDISITGLIINNSSITINYEPHSNLEPPYNFPPNSKRGLVIGPTYGDDELLIKPFDKGNIKWFYNYHTKAIGNIQSGIEFVPKIWGEARIDKSYINTNKSIMSFNEPFHKDQSNLSVAEIKSNWQSVRNMANGTRVGLVSLTGNSGNMKKQIDSLKGLSYDFMELHTFYNNINTLKSNIEAVYNHTKKPIWITEFNCHNHNDKGTYVFCTIDKQLEYMKSVLPYLEKTPYIEKYSWFTTEPYNLTSKNKADPLVTFIDKGTYKGTYKLTSTGEFYNNYVYKEGD